MEGIEKIYEMMPEGWREEAKAKKALIRGRKIKTPEELLRLILLYQTSGESYGLTSAITQISKGQIGLNKTAVQKRVTNSWRWLEWLCKEISKQEGYLVNPPEWLKKYRTCVVDASDYARNGSKGSDFRLHYMMELFTLNATELYFTDASEGETLTRYQKIQENDLILADRAYGTIKGMTHVLSKRAHVAVRLRSNCFKFYLANGEKFDLTERLKAWNPKEIQEFKLFFKNGEEMIPIRVCALGKTQEDAQRSQRQIKKANKARKNPTKLQSIWSKYVVVATTLPDEITANQILELYRMRWQIELVFKRFKSIFGGGEFSAQREDAVKAWFYGKLLLAIICEALAKEGRFSPEG